MEQDQRKQPDDNKEKSQESKEKKQRVEKKIDHELEESFPASDPPSYSQPGNGDY